MSYPRWVGLGAAATALSVLTGTVLGAVVRTPAQADQVVVHRGDTLTSLAARYGTTPWQLARVNRLSDANHIEIGQSLAVPKPALAAASGPTAGISSRRVKVALGQNLTSIAAHYGVTLAELVAANGITHPDQVEAGSTLVIPGVAAGAGGLGSVGGPSSALLDSSYGQALVASFRRWSADYGVPVNLLEALTWWESGWNYREVSSTGAIGIGQLEPATVSYVQTLLGDPALDPWVPSDNIRMTAAFLAHLLRHTGGNLDRAVAAYYQGLASVQARGEYHETAHYVAGVMAYARVF